MRNKNILIIGGAGFIGNALAANLSRDGYDVTVGDTASRLERYMIPITNVNCLAFSWLHSDTFPSFDDYSVVIHLAWASNPVSSMANIARDAELNILGTLKLLDHLPQNKIDKVIFMSSGGTVYGNSEQQPVSEDVSPNPVSAYGVSKLACEKYVDIYAKMKNYTPCILRLGNPYGAYQLQGTPVGVIANFVKKAIEKEEIIIRGSGDAVRDYIFVDDLSQYVNRVIASDIVSGTYNIASGNGTSLREILRIIENELGESLSVNCTKAPDSDVRSVVLDCDKLSDSVQFRPQIELENGIKQLMDVYWSTAQFSGKSISTSGYGS